MPLCHLYYGYILLYKLFRKCENKALEIPVDTVTMYLSKNLLCYKGIDVDILHFQLLHMDSEGMLTDYTEHYNETFCEQDPYTTLRTKLMRWLSLSREQHICQFLTLEMGDRKSSQFLRHLRSLIPDDFLHIIWSSRLPPPPTFKPSLPASPRAAWTPQPAVWTTSMRSHPSWSSECWSTPWQRRTFTRSPLAIARPDGCWSYHCERRLGSVHFTVGGSHKLYASDKLDWHTACVFTSWKHLIKSRRVRCTGHVACMGEKRNAYRISLGKPKG
jgi:hypothetical protein